MYNRLSHEQDQNLEYELLPFPFYLLTLWGIWYPSNWSIKMKILHFLFFCCVFFLDTLLCIEMNLYVLTSFGSEDFKMVNVFLTSASVTAIYKALKTRHSYENLRVFIVNYFDRKRLIPEDSEERTIYETNKLRVKQVTVIYTLSMAGVFMVKAFSPIYKHLPVEGRYPYSLDETFVYWLTYVHQILLGASLICVHIGIDTLLVGLLLNISCQINILIHRLQSVSKIYTSCSTTLGSFRLLEKKLIQCVKQHKEIYRFSEELNKQFQAILVIQVVTSIPNLCINVYMLSIDSDHIDWDYISTVFNTTSSLIQLFIICWYGNEVSLNSVQIKSAIYGINWTAFDITCKKLLIIVMARAMKPIEFTVGYIIPMNLESFIKFMKLSYSTFNLLQRTSH